MSIMETTKEKLAFRADNYQIQIIPMGQIRLSISIIDKISKIQFFEKDLTLQKIGLSTIAKAFEKTNKLINYTINYKKGGQIQMLEIKITVQSSFLKLVQQTIYLKKTNDVKEGQILKKTMNYLSQKIKDIKADLKYSQDECCQVREKQQSFSGSSGYQTYSQITLPKGKYLITWSLLASTATQVLYLYMNQGQVQLFPNSYCYIPMSNKMFVPVSFRKQHKVTQQSQKLSLQTYYSISHPIRIKNCIVTARKLE